MAVGSLPAGKCYVVSAFIEGDFAFGRKIPGAYQDFGFFSTKEDADVAAENLRIKGALTVDGITDVIVTEREETPTRLNRAETLDIPQLVMFSNGDRHFRKGDPKLPMVFVDNREFGFGRLTIQFRTDGCRSLADIRERKKEVLRTVNAKKNQPGFKIPIIV